MSERKTISKSLRFEVFKRDSFTCQYCGTKAPNVILEVDHINPVSNGGDNELMNLITSCFECNRGKSDRQLNDSSVVEKQRKQIEELNIRRQQLEMMLEWRDGERNIKDIELEKAVNYFNSKFNGSTINPSGQSKLNKLLKKYGIIKLLDAIDISVEKYYKSNDDCELVFQKIGAILTVQSMPEYSQKIRYIIGICNNKFYYINRVKMIESLTLYHNKGNNLSIIESMVKSDIFKNYTEFINFVNDNS